MVRLCLRYLKDDEETKDVISMGFVKIFKEIKKFKHQGDGSLSAWIKKIMINESLMQLRKRKHLIMCDVHENGMGMELNYSIDETLSAEEIFQTIQKIPDGYRTIFNLFIDGFSHREIGEILGITESTSRSQLSHAKRKLGELLKCHGYE